jgi:hypothetical protein
MKIRSSIITATIVFGLFIQCADDEEIISFENTNIKCRDESDNDSDGYTDCEDQDCRETSACNNSRDYQWDSGMDIDVEKSDAGEDSETPDNVGGDGSMEVCDEQGFVIDPKPVTVMLLLDYSSSMSVYPESPPHRWSQAVDALTTLLSSVSNPYISFGLDYFPDGSDTRVADGKSGECGVGKAVQMDCASDNESAIIDYLADTKAPPTTGNMTPMYCALDNFNDSDYAPGCNAEDVDRYVVLISDGSDTCGKDCHCMDTPDTCGDPAYGATASNLGSLSTKLCDNSVKTFVISFGDGADYEKLNAIAKNGCTVMTSFLDAADEAELLAAFDQILDAIVPCEYEIDEPDETEVDPTQVNFYFDDDVIRNIPMDKDCESNDGWQWVNEKHTKMRFCGETCKELKSGAVTEVTAKFGCPTVLI